MIDDLANNDGILEDLFDISDDDRSTFADADMRDYLRIAAKQHVEMEPQADEMLKEYFTATRMIRQNALSPKAFEVLQQMTKAHAKLCLRNTVNPMDVLAAINISEKYIRVLFDKDSYSSPEEPKFDSIDDIDVYYDQLHKWFLKFTQNILKRQI